MEERDDEFEDLDEYAEKSPSALDFYDITELCEEVEEENTERSPPSDKSEDLSDDDRYPVTIVPTISNGIAYDTFSIPDKPLASVLPFKYQNVDVTSIFPHFHENKVLRFLRLFGPGKPSNMPDIWRSVRKRRDLEKQKQVKFSEQTLGKSSDLEVESDEEIKFLQYTPPTNVSREHSASRSKFVKNSWRFGPARLWYDMIDVPEDAETYDYGFQLSSVNSKESEEYFDQTPGDAFLMVSQQHWEDDVIWDGEEVKEDVMKNVYHLNKPSGWIPVSMDRTFSSFTDHVNVLSSHSEKPNKLPNISNCFTLMNNSRNNVNNLLFRSIFPVENPELLHDRWEDDIVWDSSSMERISHPKDLKITDNDIVLVIPEDLPPPAETTEVSKDRDKKYRPAVKKDDSDIPEPVTIKQDFYNISNDEYYNAKMTQDAALKLGYGGSLIQHSIPAVELRPPYFPTYMGPLKLRRFHRPPLRHYSHGPLSQVDFHGVRCLTKHIKQKEKKRRKEIEESGGGEIFSMFTPKDLSAKDGELVLFEFSEEHPPLMMQVGMASKIRNYYRRRPGKDNTTIICKYGEVAYAHSSPFLGALQPGQTIQAYENHLFRSPIYQHEFPACDFVIIRTRYKYYIREIETIYTVGQELPLIEVPAPKSEKANSFMKDFLMVFIYRLFGKSEDNPRRIKMEDIKKAFPTLREFSIRKRLNLCADFQRTGFDSKFWVLKSGFRLPSEEEIRQMVSPEQVCAYYSMLAAEQRLKDAGYGDKFLLMVEDETDVLQNRIDDEVKAAPWNTTQAFISAVRGKCLLELLGVADPTGCGEGFAYVKVPNKPQWLKDECSVLNPAKRLVKGTDADLRRLSLSSAKKLLKTFNVPEREIKKMTRWQIIDVVRTLSTEQAKLGEGITKFARGNFFSQAEHQRKYKEECQRLFDLQNRVLSSKEVLSTDEDSSSEEDSDLEEMGKHIENILSNKKTAKELSHECEEAERKELQKLMSSEASQDSSQKTKLDRVEPSNSESKVLKIYRTYRNINGHEFVRIETVRRPEVIELYTKIRDTKNEEFIKTYAIDEEQKEAYRRERRRLQDQLRRIKRNELKEKEYNIKEPSKKKIKIDQANLFKVKCGACGAAGHMRTNKSCPLYQSSPSLPPIQVAMTEEQEEEEENAGLYDQDLIKLDETKLILSKTLIKHADELRRKSLVIKIPKEAVLAAKRKKALEMSSGDYLSAPKLVNRKRIDPLVSISVIFENLINDLKNLTDTQPFWLPVSSKIAPNYHIFIQKPMDLHSMKEKARKQQYKNREDFLVDMTQIVENSKIFNGPNSYLTYTAQNMLEFCLKSFSEKEEKLMQLEKAINPLLDDDQVAFSFMLETIVNEQLKTVPESWPFHKPVDRRLAKGYYDIIKTPMDLDTIIKNCKVHKYKTRADFISDVELIFSNSMTFNGSASQFTKIAQNIVEACHVSMEMYESQLEKLETGIKNSGKNESSVPAFVPTPPKRRKRLKMSNRSMLEPLDNKLADQPNVNHSDLNKAIDQSSCNEAVFNSTCESMDVDSFIDVESVEVSQNHYVDDLSEKSDVESNAAYPLEEVNSRCTYSPPSDAFFQNGDSTSPTGFATSQSLNELNGDLETDKASDHFNENLQSFPSSTCDNICDDLMLSESDSNASAAEDELHF